MLPSLKVRAPAFLAVIATAGATLSPAGETLENPENQWATGGPGGTPSFTKHIVPLFNKAGCSARECHGSFQGQNGFRLSLFGYDRSMDFEELVNDTENDEKNGTPRPRIDRDHPDQSLALQKPLDEIDHEGGRKLKRGTWQHRMFRDWIAAGAPFDAETEPYLENLELDPPQEAGAVLGPDGLATPVRGNLSFGRSLCLN